MKKIFTVIVGCLMLSLLIAKGSFADSSEDSRPEIPSGEETSGRPEKPGYSQYPGAIYPTQPIGVHIRPIGGVLGQSPEQETEDESSEEAESAGEGENDSQYAQRIIENDSTSEGFLMAEGPSASGCSLQKRLKPIDTDSWNKITVQLERMHNHANSI